MKDLWYAVMRDREDLDWGYGSNDKSEALKMLAKMIADGEEGAYIAVIDEGDDPICVDEIGADGLSLAR